MFQYSPFLCYNRIVDIYKTLKSMKTNRDTTKNMGSLSFYLKICVTLVKIKGFNKKEGMST